MTLRIRPVKLKQSIYLRIPSNIADLIGIDSHAEVTLNLEEQDNEFLLVYSVRKQPQQDHPPHVPSEGVLIAKQPEQLAPVVSEKSAMRLDE